MTPRGNEEKVIRETFLAGPASQLVRARSLRNLRARLHGGGGPQVGEVTCSASPHLSCKRGQIKMRDYMDRRVTPPERVTLPTWSSPPPCKQALS